MQGIVYKSTGSWYIVKDQQNNFIECKLAGKLRNSESKSTNPVCTGDSVTVKIDNNKTNPSRIYISSILISII